MKKCWRKTGYTYQIHLHQAFLELSNALSIPEQVFERSEEVKKADNKMKLDMQVTAAWTLRLHNRPRAKTHGGETRLPIWLILSGRKEDKENILLDVCTISKYGHA